jgi:hypothetical protein
MGMRAWVALALLSMAFGSLWTVSGDAFLVEEARSHGHFPLERPKFRGSSSSSFLESLPHGIALHGGEIPPWLLPAWCRFLQFAVERRLLDPYRRKPESYGIAFLSRMTIGVGPADGVDCRVCLQLPRWLVSECVERPSVLSHSRSQGGRNTLALLFGSCLGDLFRPCGLLVPRLNRNDLRRQLQASTREPHRLIRLGVSKHH